MRDVSSDSLYLHCEECEWGWRNPEEANNVASGFLTLDADFEAEPATKGDIDRYGWAAYVAGHFEA